MISLACLSIFLSNFVVAGPAVSLLEMAHVFNVSISKVSYLFTATAMVQGLGNLIWVPFVNKYGRRLVYIVSFTMFTACAIWAGLATSYESILGARLLAAFASGAAECLAPITVADVSFVHERGKLVA